MKKTQIIKTLMIAVFIAASTSSSSSAEYVTSPGSTFFQQVVLMHERSPDLNIQVNRLSLYKGRSGCGVGLFDLCVHPIFVKGQLYCSSRTILEQIFSDPHLFKSPFK